MKLMLGIDDAGRGPVIGPMVMAGCLINERIEDEFKKLRVRDSKLVPPKRREELASIIRKKALNYEIFTIPPDEIDDKLTKKRVNLNKIEALYAAEIVNRLNKSIEHMHVIVDCPSNNITSWRNYLLTHIKNKENLSLICAHKADRDYVAVSAASILAKSTREKEVRRLKVVLKKEFNIHDDFGSGYPSDPLTEAFLKKYFNVLKGEGIFRESWATWKNHHAKTEQRRLLDF
ncbi:ribonuclease HII [Candidatus Pacearchaeota archaeon]|nr:ribonuclease HII [Candidatus Pacearchaeota archaeon]